MKEFSLIEDRTEIIDIKGRYFCGHCAEEIRNDYQVGENCPNCNYKFINIIPTEDLKIV